MAVRFNDCIQSKLCLSKVNTLSTSRDLSMTVLVETQLEVSKREDGLVAPTI